MPAAQVAQNTPTAPRIALACDWLTTPGGAEKVLLELHHMYPDAPIYTSQYRRKGINWFDDAEVRTGWLQIFPAALRKFLGPLRQLYFSRLDLTPYDLVISVTGAEAKSLKAKTHLCYCHVPTQYYWQMYDKYVENPGFGFLNPLVRLCFKLLVKPLRKADYAAAQKPTKFITISDYAAAQIEKYYHREAAIVAPPVDIHKFSTRNPQPNFDFSTDDAKKSTPSANKPTSDTKKSTDNAQISTETSQKSTKSAKISTKNRELSTSFPQEIHSPTSTFPLPIAQNDLTDADTSLESTSAFAQCSPNVRPMSAQPLRQAPEIIPKSASKQPPEILSRASVRPALAKTPTNLEASVDFEPPVSSEPPFVISCRQVTWKRVDLAIEACLKTQQPLLVIGDGPEHKNLVKLAHGSSLITFIPWLETADLASYLQTAKAYLFPSLEPFGIAAVEALAAGCPVIAYAEGGSRDFIHASGPGKNGLLFPEQTAESLAGAIQSFDPADFDHETIRKSAEKFSPAIFRQRISALVDETLAKDSLVKDTLTKDTLSNQSPNDHSRASKEDSTL